MFASFTARKMGVVAAEGSVQGAVRELLSRTAGRGPGIRIRTRTTGAPTAAPPNLPQERLGPAQRSAGRTAVSQATPPTPGKPYSRER